MFLLLPAWFLTGASGAPLPPRGAVDITGVIESVEWVPETTEQAKPGFSGSLGRKRTFPSHLAVTLKDYKGPAAVDARQLNFLVGARQLNSSNTAAAPTRLMVWINTGDRDLLRTGMRIRLRAYTVTGDEGGTWAHHGEPEILSK